MTIKETVISLLSIYLINVYKNFIFEKKFMKFLIILSDKAISFIEKLKSIFPNKFFFIIGETSYGYCCADEIAALHLKAELIIRIGNSCLTKTQNIPVFFLFEEEEFTNKYQNELIENFIEFSKANIFNENQRTFVIMLVI